MKTEQETLLAVFHNMVLNRFHEYRRGTVGDEQIFVRISGGQLIDLLLAARRDTLNSPDINQNNPLR